MNRRNFLLGAAVWPVIPSYQWQIFDYPTISPVPLPMTEAEKQWFGTNFVQSCCNLGDAFISDLAFEKDGKYYAEITDGFDHHPNVLRAIIPPGTIREVPAAVFKKMSAPGVPQNPTSHGIIFLHLYMEGGEPRGIRTDGGSTRMPVKPEDADVLCYWPPAGT
jgi:hypothetical protein